MLCDSLEEWDEGEVQEGRAIPVLRADVCYCIAGTNAILESNYLPVKNKFKKKAKQNLVKALVLTSNVQEIQGIKDNFKDHHQEAISQINNQAIYYRITSLFSSQEHEKEV